MRTREIGTTGVSLTELGFGGGGLGELFVKVSDAQAEDTLETAWAGGIRFYDSAPYYGGGLSEHRIGRFLRERPRSEFTVCTKVGRLLRVSKDPDFAGDPFWAGGLPFEQIFDFSYDAIMRAHEDSLQRFGLTRLDLLVIHDLDRPHHEADEFARHWETLEQSGWRALEELRSAGAIGAIGSGVNGVDEVDPWLDAFDLDFLIFAGRYTLLDQSSFPGALARCERDGVGVIAAAVFNSGILSQSAAQGQTFDYQPAPQDLRDRAARLAEACDHHAVPLRAAAIQFPLAHPVIRSVLTGPISPEQAQGSLDAYAHEIPPALWNDLRSAGLIAEGAPTPGGTPA